MTLRVHTDEEKLQVIESAITAAKRNHRELEARWGAQGAAAEANRIEVLRAVAADLRARGGWEIGETLRVLDARIRRVKGSSRERPPEGEAGHHHHQVAYNRDELRALGQDVVSRWPEIRAALLDAGRRG